jgi:hypothetical protein
MLRPEAHRLPHCGKAGSLFAFGLPCRRPQTWRLSRDKLPHIAAGSVIPLGMGQMAIGVGRRQFISALGGALLAWPPAVGLPSSCYIVRARLQQRNSIGRAHGRSHRQGSRCVCGAGGRFREDRAAAAADRHP